MNTNSFATWLREFAAWIGEGLMLLFAFIVSMLGVVFGFAVVILFLASPFIAIGLGVGLGIKLIGAFMGLL